MPYSDKYSTAPWRNFVGNKIESKKISQHFWYGEIGFVIVCIWPVREKLVKIKTWQPFKSDYVWQDLPTITMRGEHSN